MPHKRIVYIVDDDEEVRWALNAALKKAGFYPRTFVSAEEFLVDGPTNSDQSGCILIDFKLPGMDGPMLQAELIQRGIDLPMVMITAYADVNSAIQVMRAGAVDLLQKPFTTAALVERLRETFEKQEEQLEAQKWLDDVNVRLATLSHREGDVLDEIRAGKTNKQISAALDIGIQTVAKHKARILKKLGVKNDLELLLLLTRDRGAV
jgi:two-component system, LuxR family, response regulator FixJ